MSIQVGQSYYPEAFEPENLALAQVVCASDESYQAFIRYVLCIIGDVTQLVHFRSILGWEFAQVVGKPPSPEVTWCILSLFTEKYFAAKAQVLDWTSVETENLKAGWFALIAPAFVPSLAGSKMQAESVRNWVAQYLIFHTQSNSKSPMSFELALRRFQYEASILAGSDSFIRQFLATNRKSVDLAQAIAIYCGLKAQAALLGESNSALAYCLSICLSENPLFSAAINLDEAESLSLTTMLKDVFSLEFAANTGSVDLDFNNLGDVKSQLRDLIVRQAQAGVPWRDICAEVMSKNEITVEEIEAELTRQQIV